MVHWNLLLLLVTLAVESGLGLHTKEDLTIYRVEDVDFDNTKISKYCLLARFNATIEMNFSTEGVARHIVLPFPDEAGLHGSYCNVHYKSQLQMNFGDDVITMVFARDKISPSIPKKITYCDQCDYGTWNLTSLVVDLLMESKYRVSASIPDNIRDHAKWLSDGIDIKRSFECTAADNLIIIPLVNPKVMNTKNEDDIHIEWLSGNIKFYSIQVQPFLVVTDTFYDPYLCRDVTLSHVLVIMLPLIYFFIFILFYRIKAGHGCPWRMNDKQKPEKLTTEIEMEESTNIMSDEYSTIQMGLASSSIPY